MGVDVGGMLLTETVGCACKCNVCLDILLVHLLGKIQLCCRTERTSKS